MVVEDFYFQISRNNHLTEDFLKVRVLSGGGADVLGNARQLATKYAKKNGIKYKMLPTAKRTKIIDDYVYNTVVEV